MKRSKAFLAANILSTIYVVVLFWIFGGIIINLASADLAAVVGATFAFIVEFVGSVSDVEAFLVIIFALFCIHVALLLLGFLFGWIGYAAKSSVLAKLAAVCYLLATIVFPASLLIGLPMIIVGFIGGSKQKAINKARKAA